MRSAVRGLAGLDARPVQLGGKTRLGSITKAGDAYLRTMLILGARAVLAAAKNKTDALSRWAAALEARRRKNARMCWAMAPTKTEPLLSIVPTQN